jgi:hypothetical protein
MVTATISETNDNPFWEKSKGTREKIMALIVASSFSLKHPNFVQTNFDIIFIPCHCSVL